MVGSCDGCYEAEDEQVMQDVIDTLKDVNERLNRMETETRSKDVQPSYDVRGSANGSSNVTLPGERIIEDVLPNIHGNVTFGIGRSGDRQSKQTRQTERFPSDPQVSDKVPKPPGRRPNDTRATRAGKQESDSAPVPAAKYREGFSAQSESSGAVVGPQPFVMSRGAKQRGPASPDDFASIVE